MELYKDLTYYSFDHFENAYNVGWVDIDKEKNELYGCNEIIERLIPFLKYPLNTIRSLSDIKKWTYAGEEYTLGFSELRIISDDRKVYAIPNTILYYISEKGYKPPEVFLDALFNGVSSDSNEYSEYLKRYNQKDFWGASEEQKIKVEKIESIIKDKDLNFFEELISNDNGALATVTNYGSLLNCAILNDAEEIALKIIDKGGAITNYNGLELITAIEKKKSSIADKLIEAQIPIRNDVLKFNPLFIAIAYKCNDIAVRLLTEYPELNQSYSNEHVKDCDLLQWCAVCNNLEMFSLIKKY